MEKRFPYTHQPQWAQIQCNPSFQVLGEAVVGGGEVRARGGGVRSRGPESISCPSLPPSLRTPRRGQVPGAGAGRGVLFGANGRKDPKSLRRQPGPGPSPEPPRDLLPAKHPASPGEAPPQPGCLLQEPPPSPGLVLRAPPPGLTQPCPVTGVGGTQPEPSSGSTDYLRGPGDTEANVTFHEQNSRH